MTHKDYSSNHIVFSDDLFMAILHGSKTATTRLGSRNYRLGEGTISSVGSSKSSRSINIMSITYKVAGLLTDRDAQLEGYSNKKVLWDALLGIYGSYNLTSGSVITFVEFELIKPSLKYIKGNNE